MVRAGRRLTTVPDLTGRKLTTVHTKATSCFQLVRYAGVHNRFPDIEKSRKALLGIVADFDQVLIRITDIDGPNFPHSSCPLHDSFHYLDIFIL